jgi:host factor-I protein
MARHHPFSEDVSIKIRRSAAMDSKPAQNIQDTFLNTVRKDKSPITIYLVSGVKLTGRIRSFDKYSVLLENNAQEQLIFKHAISTVVSGRPALHAEPRSSSSAGAEHRPGPSSAGAEAAGSPPAPSAVAR